MYSRFIQQQNLNFMREKIGSSLQSKNLFVQCTIDLLVFTFIIAADCTKFKKWWSSRPSAGMEAVQDPEVQLSYLIILSCNDWNEETISD